MKMRMRDGTGAADLKWLVEDVDRHGNVRVYVRRKGRGKIRIKERVGTPEFMIAYRAALTRLEDAPAASAEDIVAGSLRWLCVAYYRAGEFKRLGAGTRAVRKGILDGLCAKHGHKPFARMEARHVRELRDEKAELPEAANGRVKALRQLFAWAVEAELAKANPARDVKYFRGNPDGFHTWTVEEVRQYEARHPVGTKARLALDLFLYTGVRRSDAVRLGRQMERHGWLQFTETKGADNASKARAIPILPVLRASIDAAPSGHLAYLVTEFGKPFTHAGFGNWFRKRCDEAGLKHCSAHGLRKAGATIAAENGATEHQLMAIYGWESPKQAALYTRKANRKKLAGEAMHLLVPDQEANAGVPLPIGEAAGGVPPAKKRR